MAIKWPTWIARTLSRVLPGRWETGQVLTSGELSDAEVRHVREQCRGMSSYQLKTCENAYILEKIKVIRGTTFYYMVSIRTGRTLAVTKQIFEEVFEKRSK